MIEDAQPDESWMDERIRCPHCGNVETLNGYDVGGADEGCAFCNRCHLEFVLAAAESVA